MTLVFLAPALLLLTQSLVLAENAAQPGQISLDDCIAAALRGNVNVLTAKNNIGSAQARSAIAASDYLPQVSLQNTAFTWGSSGVLNKATTGTALTISQNIFDGGLREANVRRSRYGLVQSTAGLTRTQQSVDYSVSEAYYEVLRAQHLAEVAQANVTYNEGLRDQVQARADVGDAAKTDVLPIEAQLAAARVSLLSSKNAVRTAKIQLQSLMGQTPRSDFGVEEVGAPPAEEIAPLERYHELAMQSRPDIQQYQAATGAAQASVSASRISLYPRPTITASYQRQVSGGFTTGGGQVIGVFVFDIFSGGANRAAYKEARIAESNAVLQEEQLARDITSGVEEAYLNMTSAKERLAASDMSLAAADRNYQVQKERYAQGLGTTLDLMNAEVQLVTAQSDDIQARYDCHVAVAQLEYAVGGQGGLQ